MNYRTLGKTGLKIAEVGMGTWQLANDPNMWVGSDLAQSLQCLHEYVDRGGNFIDTAWVYGFSDDAPERHPSEELIGKFLKESGKRSEVFVATKVAPKNWHWPAWRADTLDDCFPSDHIEAQVHDSLRSLCVDYIDLVQFHVWNDLWAQDERWQETVRKLTASGKVRNWGISINDYQPSNCLAALDTGLISTIQFIFNIFHQKPEEKLLPYAKEHNIGLIARVPLDEGGLTGKFTKDTTFAEGDFRSRYFKGERLFELVARTTELKKLVGDEVSSLPELSLRWILSHPEVSTVIPGMRKVEHVQLNTAVSEKGPLSTALLQAIRNHAWERNFYSPGEVDPTMELDGYIEK